MEPLLELEPQLNEDWFLVSESWFYQFSDSINLDEPLPNDSWEFPEPIPIDHSDIYTDEKDYIKKECKLLHSKAWELLLRFNGISTGSVPIPRKTFFNGNTEEVQVPISPTCHKLYICYSRDSSINHIKGVLRTFPYETFEDLIEKISEFYKLYTVHTPKLYCFEIKDSVSWVEKDTRYTVTRPNYGIYPDYKQTPSIYFLASQIGLDEKQFLLVIPNSLNNAAIQVVSNFHTFDKKRT